jgi:hypothetical protein
MVWRLGDLINVAESSNLDERYSQLCFPSKNLFMGIEIAINRFFYLFVKFRKNNGDLLNNGVFQNINESVKKKRRLLLKNYELVTVFRLLIGNSIFACNNQFIDIYTANLFAK